ncbi:YecA family protein [Bacillus massilinigeriensis]|uniref:YecA family protein n=1 Tax=Bacillus massilionigeriensis TaxID=1805475 RepID=UPI000BE8F740|nr:SEC-C domain-containing protein [Bacillus massilionigeriensis]
MSVGRNDPCPCGSGRKYKQCCLKKEKVVELGQVKQGHFFQMKNRLVERLLDEVIGTFSFSEYQSLKRKFRERTGVHDIWEGFCDHWLVFFYRNPAFGGLRGIEWYNRNRGRKDEPALQRMAQAWETLVPRLIQHVDFNDQGVLVEDLFAHERFHMPYCETLSEPRPWGGLFGLLEEWDGGYFMNGVAAIVGPGELKKAENLLRSCLEKTGDSYGKTAIDFYPEIIGVLFQKEDLSDGETKELVETKLYYSMSDINVVMNAIHRTGLLVMDEWDGQKGRGSIVSKRYRYDDNLAKGSVYLNEIEGLLEIKGNQLIFQSIKQETVTEVKELLDDIPEAVFIKEKKESQKVPVRIQMQNYSVALDEGVPSVFAFFSHQAVINQELNSPLPQFEGKTPTEMVALKRFDELELWLREAEFVSYENTRKQSKERWTADYNTIRRALNLPLSPFTTLREKRESVITLLESPVNPMVDWTQEEIELWDEMGIPVHEMKNAYARDLLEFFQEKGAGRSANTFYKYRLGVQVISYFFVEEGINRTTTILPEQWEALLAYYYLDFNFDATENQAKGFFTVVKSFAAWLDERHGTTYGSIVKQLVKDLEVRILQSIAILEAYTPYRERRYDFAYSLGELRRTLENGEVPGSLEEGHFLVKSVTTKYVNLVKIDDKSGQTYKTTIPKGILPLFQPGMIICGSLSKKTNWKIYSVERVYPR